MIESNQTWLCRVPRNTSLPLTQAVSQKALKRRRGQTSLDIVAYSLSLVLVAMFVPTAQRAGLVRVSLQRDFPDSAKQLLKTGVATEVGRSTKVLTKKPINPSISRRLRPATGVPTTMSSSPDKRYSNSETLLQAS